MSAKIKLRMASRRKKPTLDEVIQGLNVDAEDIEIQTKKHVVELVMPLGIVSVSEPRLQSALTHGIVHASKVSLFGSKNSRGLLVRAPRRILRHSEVITSSISQLLINGDENKEEQMTRKKQPERPASKSNGDKRAVATFKFRVASLPKSEVEMENLVKSQLDNIAQICSTAGVRVKGLQTIEVSKVAPH